MMQLSIIYNLEAEGCARVQVANRLQLARGQNQQIDVGEGMGSTVGWGEESKASRDERFSSTDSVLPCLWLVEQYRVQSC